MPESPKEDSGGKAGWVLLALAVGAMLLAATCDSRSTSVAPPAEAPSAALPDPLPVVETEAAAPDVDRSAVTRAGRHLRLALDSEGVSGAMIYSQNCFASLEWKFSWAKLDQCDAFDTLMLTAVASGLPGTFGAETSYFARSSVEERYNAALLLSGSDSGDLLTHHGLVQAVASEQIAELASAAPSDGLPLAAQEGAAETLAHAEASNEIMAEPAEPTPEAAGDTGESVAEDRPAMEDRM